MNKVVQYARSSTGNEGLNHQFQVMKDSLNPESTIVGSCADLTPGPVLDRAGLQAALTQAADGGVDTLMVTSLDRLARTSEELATLKERLKSWGVSLHSTLDPQVNR